MVKNIFKSLFWVALYFILQTVGLLGVFFYDLFSQNLVFTDIQNADLFYEELMNYLYGIALPGLLVGAIVYFGIFIIYKLIRKHPFDFKTINYNKLLMCLCIGWILNVVVTILINVFALVLPESITNALNDSTALALEGFPLWFTLLATGICVPILEELVFRYGICGIMGRKNALVGLIVSSVIFGLVHGNPIQIVYATALGFVFGYIYLKHGNIWYPIMLHMAVNSSSVLVSSLEAPWLYGVFVALAVVNIVILIKQEPELKNFFKKGAYSEQFEIE